MGQQKPEVVLYAGVVDLSGQRLDRLMLKSPAECTEAAGSTVVRELASREAGELPLSWADVQLNQAGYGSLDWEKISGHVHRAVYVSRVWLRALEGEGR